MLQTIEQSEIVVAEELHFIDQYLQIQRFRLGNRFGPVWWPTPNLSAL
jgi:sensor histidine kinase YesM